jgi:DNA-binding transcriptional LysR family regulator
MISGRWRTGNQVRVGTTFDVFAVARTGTLSAAAEQLGTEHTTVARHIHALEEELNSRLFQRSNSGYGLTEVGERLLAGAETTESAYASTKAAASSEGQTIGGTVRIATPGGFGSLFLAPRVRVLIDRHPKLEIEFLVTARQFSLLKREADIAIGLPGPEHMRLVSRRLTDYRLYVYGSLAYLEKATPIITVQDLKNIPLSIFSRSKRSLTIGSREHWCRFDLCFCLNGTHVEALVH